MSFQTKYDEYKDMVNTALDNELSDMAVPQSWLRDAMRYSLMGNGKRLRPILVLEFSRAAGGTIEDAMPLACAVEMLHTYSLIHDDLPCMDDDDLRRGRASCHIEFGEATAVLAGDALQAEAFYKILSAPLSDTVRARCARILSKAAGESGMCGGQILDIDGQATAQTEQELKIIHRMKTSALLEASCIIGAICGGATEEQIDAAREYAKNLGLAFQIRDDMLDVIASTNELGKPAGSDRREGKTTFMSLYGEEKCEKLVVDLTEKARRSLSGGFSDFRFLSALANEMAVRRK